MSGDTPKDPSAQFQEWVTQWERAVDEFSNRIMGTDEFSRSMNQMQGLQLELQRRFGEMMAKQLAGFNMPSRDDVIRISEDLRALDRRMAHIERALDRLLAAEEDKGGGKRKGPTRTKKPPARKG